MNLQVKYLILTVLALFFLYFGIQVLIAAYDLNDPFTFVLTFFASNLIILISLAIAVGMVWRMVVPVKNTEPDDDDSPQDSPQDNP